MTQDLIVPPKSTCRLWALIARIGISCVAAAVPLSAQPALTLSPLDGTTPAINTPGSPAGAYRLSSIESINFANGHLNLSIPLVDIPGRGAAKQTLLLRIASHWRVESHQFVYNCSGESGCSFGTAYIPLNTPWGADEPTSANGVMLSREVGDFCMAAEGVENGGAWGNTLTRLTFIAPDGTEHEFRDAKTGGMKQGLATNWCASTPGCTDAFRTRFDRGNIWDAYDGSGARFVSSESVLDVPRAGCVSEGGVPVGSGTVYLRDGTKYTITFGYVTKIEDRNGNVLNLPAPSGGAQSISDALGRTTTISAPVDNVRTITYPGYGGQMRTITITYDSLGNLLAPDAAPAPKTLGELFGFINFGCPGVPCANDAYRAQLYNPVGFVKSVRYANGSEYQFRYNEYGDVARIILPTGGSYRYQFQHELGEIGPTTNGYPAGYYAQSVLRRREAWSSDSRLAQVTEYSALTGGGTLAMAGHVVHRPVSPEGIEQPGALSVEDHHSYLIDLSLPLDGAAYKHWTEGKEYRTDYFDADQTTLLRSESSMWQQVPCTGCWWDDPQYNPSGKIPEYNPHVTQKTTTLADAEPDVSSREEYEYDAFNNRTLVREYGFAGALVRQTETAYKTDTAYLDRRLLSLPERQTVKDAGGNRVAETTFAYDESTPAPAAGITSHNSDAGTVRGNVTSVSQWLDVTDSTLTSTHQYDIAGNLIQSLDPRGVCARWGYADSRNTYALPASITTYKGLNCTGLAMTASVSYDHDIGKATGTTDVNAQTTTYAYSDALERLTRITRPTGVGQTNIGYMDTPGSVTVETTISDGPHTTLHYDGLGRQERSVLVGACEDGGDVQTTTSYDGKGRVSQVSNPYCGSTATDSTMTEYDGLDRVLKVTEPGGAITTTGYEGAVTRVTDPATVKRESTVDALGRLIQVIENPGGDPAYTTAYQYDLLDNLTQVNQSGQTRTFLYDSLKRLREATNRESGTITYTYDAGGNLATRTDQRGTKTFQPYDGRNRPTSFSYSDGTPAVTYTYDEDFPIPDHTEENSPVGRLTKVASSASESTYRYDALGRAASSMQETDEQPYVFGYTYNLAGALQSLTYPSGRAVSYAHNNAGRVTAAYGGAGQTDPYASEGTYAPHGAITSLKLGNGLYETVLYNNRLQPHDMKLGTAAGGDGKWRLENVYGSTSNNGNVLEQRISAPGLPTAITEFYKYDRFNRIALAVEQPQYPAEVTCSTASGTFCQQYGYDAWGNRLITARTGIGTAASEPSAYDPLTNRIAGAGFSYDLSGNLTATPAGQSFRYDGENRQTEHCNHALPCTAANATTRYVYDGEGRRLKKVEGSVTTTYVYDAQGQLAAEYGGPPQTVVGRTFLTQDHLGTTRVITGAGGAVLERRDYLPFGDEIGVPAGSPRLTVADGGYTNNVATPLKFTGKERDTETGLDYFGARYFSGAQGRFTSPDKPFADQHQTDPQSWNLYSYARNNPLRFIDTDGEAVKPTVTIVPFRVHGKTYQEARKDAIRQVNIEQDGVEGAASEYSRIRIVMIRRREDASPSTRFIPSFAFSEVKAADVILTTTINMPVWAEKDSASPEDRKTWDDAMVGLEAHERAHAAVDLKVAEELDRSLPGTRGTGQAGTPAEALANARADRNQKLSKAQNQTIKKMGQENRKYDLSNCHNLGGQCNAGK